MKYGKIMVVDDSLVSLTICEKMIGQYYDIVTSPSIAKMFQQLDESRPDLILLDISMPGITGLDGIKMLKNHDIYKYIPVIMLTSHSSPEIEKESLKLGACDIIKKPYEADLIMLRINHHLSASKQIQKFKKSNFDMNTKLRSQSEEIINLQNALASIVVGLIEYRDITTGKHILTAKRYMECMIKKMIYTNGYHNEMAKWNFENISLSAQLHDIGKIGIRDIILNKPGKLTYEEFEKIKEHVEIGEKIINHMIETIGESSLLQQAKMFILYHHENWDGSGYPYGLKGLDIPLEGRLLAIVDVYDALTSDRPYKSAMSHQDSVDLILKDCGKKFDPHLIEIFKDVQDEIQEISEMAHRSDFHITHPTEIDVLTKVFESHIGSSNDNEIEGLQNTINWINDNMANGKVT